ncbi:unnamed protein product, partial [Meganyctiphanes norvegica]
EMEKIVNKEGRRIMEEYSGCNTVDIIIHQVHTSKETELLNKVQEEQKDDVNRNSDDMFTAIGLGRWHILPILVAFLYQAASPTQLISSVFTNMPLDYKCYTVSGNSIAYKNVCKGLDHKHMNTSCSKIEFNHNVFKTTFTSEFELICDKSWISNLYQLSVTIGLLFGSLLGGIADKWGRLTVIRVGALGCLLGVLLVGFGPNVYLILAGRLLTGFFCNILNISSFTLAIENTPAHLRSTISLFIMIGYPLSVVLKGIISYYLRYWRMLHLTISCYIYLIVILIIFLDKSPRWLFQNGKIEEGIRLLEKIIKLNKSDKKKVIDFEYFINESRQRHNLKELNSKYDCNPFMKLKHNISVFFKNPAMGSISVITPIIWFITGLVYFGVPLNANNFTDNPFIYMVLIGVVEAISILFGGMVLDKFGNIRTCAFFFGTTGSCLLFILAVSEELWWLKWILILIAMMSISMCYALCYIMASELYPSEVRSAGMGICCFSCFMGFILSSMLSETVARNSNYVFNVVCSAFCFLAIVLMVCLLPETKGEILCETIEDVAERNKRLKHKT